MTGHEPAECASMRQRASAGPVRPCPERRMGERPNKISACPTCFEVTIASIGPSGYDGEHDVGGDSTSDIAEGGTTLPCLLVPRWCCHPDFSDN
jgi:hypothetical protein